MENIPLKSVIYRALHRGSQESDRILGGFARDVGPGLSDQELGDLTAILNHDDPVVFEWLSEPDTLPLDLSRPLLDKIITYRKKLTQGDGGFSLVELAIALAVIGVMIGAVLKGRELIESAQLKSTLAQVNQYRLATQIFLDKYDALPGNFKEAKVYIDGGLENGTGNGIIAGKGFDKTESLHFWAHLSKAGLISTSDPPPGKIGGTFTVKHDVFGEGKHWLVLGTKKGDEGNGPLLTPLQARSMAKRTDTDSPSTGSIRAKDGDGENQTCVKDGKYTGGTKKACVVYFELL